MKNKLLTISELERLDKKLLEKYLQFFFHKSTIEQVRDICKKKGLTEKEMLRLAELALGNDFESVFPMDNESNYDYYHYLIFTLFVKLL